MFARLCALSRKTMRINAHATILVKHKGAEHQSPKRKSQLYYFTPLRAPAIKGPSQTAGTWGLSPADGTGGACPVRSLHGKTVPIGMPFKNVPNNHSFKPVPNERNHSFKSVPNE